MSRRRRPGPPVALINDATAMNRLQTGFRERHPDYRLAAHRVVGRFAFDANSGMGSVVWCAVVNGDLVRDSGLVGGSDVTNGGTLSAGTSPLTSSSGTYAPGDTFAVTAENPVALSGRGNLIAIRSDLEQGVDGVTIGQHTIADTDLQAVPAGVAFVVQASERAAICIGDIGDNEEPVPLRSGHLIAVGGAASMTIRGTVTLVALSPRVRGVMALSPHVG